MSPRHSCSAYRAAVKPQLSCAHKICSSAHIRHQVTARATVCVRAKRLPRDFAELVAAVHDARIRLVICGLEPPRLTELVLAPIKIPALATRAHELDQIIDEYADEARVALQISTPLKDADRHLVRVRCASSLPEVEKGAWRMLALRQAGSVAGAADLLGMGHTSLGEWVQRRRGWRPSP